MNVIAEPDDRASIILVVDDDPSGMGVIVTHLKEHGFQVVISRDGESGLKRAEYARPDLILLDVTMPGIDGFETCRRLKANEHTKDIPVIFLTALSDTVDKVRGFKVGGADYITKPFHVEEALSRIETHLSLRKTQQRLQEANDRLRLEIVERKRVDKELRKAKDAAEVANKLKSAFLANMSHELRTPLNAILGFSQLLGRSANLDPDEQKNMATVHSCGKHLLDLINDVLDMSKLEAGRTVFNEKDFDLYSLADDVEAMFCLKAEEKELRVVFECDSDVPRYLRTDEGKLRQTLMNLIGNAIKFTENGGVTVRIKKNPEVVKISEVCTLVFEVEDTGPGIAPDEINSLFEAFTQTETGLLSGEGTGLGLPISQKFVQIMGGDITVVSEIGKGAVFSFWIQAETARDTVPEDEPPERRVIALEAGQPRYRILIVDDIESNRLLLLNMLAFPGLKLREAENGEEAVAIKEKWQPHLILMDMRMPVTDGYTATKKIRNVESRTVGFHSISHCTIIAMTANVLGNERDAALAAGCDDLIWKPFTDSQIFNMMHRHIGMRFVYVEETDSHVTELSETDKLKAFTPEALGALPQELLAELKHVVLLGYAKKVTYLINNIRSYNTALADALTILNTGYRYDIILEAIEKSVITDKQDI